METNVKPKAPVQEELPFPEVVSRGVSAVKQPRDGDTAMDVRFILVNGDERCACILHWESGRGHTSVSLSLQPPSGLGLRFVILATVAVLAAVLFGGLLLLLRLGSVLDQTPFWVAVCLSAAQLGLRMIPIGKWLKRKQERCALQ